MEKDNTEHRVICYVGNDGRTLLRCPKCKITKTIDAKNHHNLINTFKTKCTCGSVIRGQFDFRRHYRKKVSLPGSYLQMGSEIKGWVSVEDISGMGVGFSCLGEHNLQKGDYIDITFTLDNPKKSTVALWIEVMNINESFVGAKRCNTQLEQPDLEMYLR
jgi:hypothetical protein